jgi:hypothetical protein
MYGGHVFPCQSNLLNIIDNPIILLVYILDARDGESTIEFQANHR